MPTLPSTSRIDGVIVHICLQRFANEPPMFTQSTPHIPTLHLPPSFQVLTSFLAEPFTLNFTARAANYRLLALNLHTFFPLHNVSWKSHFFKNRFNSTTAERTIYVIRQHSITIELFSMTAAGPYSFTRSQDRFPSTADSAS